LLPRLAKTERNRILGSVWSDNAKYETGGFRHVWESIRPHFEEVQATPQRVTILAGSSQSLISDSGDSEF
jgi:hypothetical protein